ncbi:MAG: tetratricopeptide repeat protein [bacterium]
MLTTRHRFTELRALAEQLTADNPADDAAWALLADAALALGDHATTERALDRLLDLRPALPAFTRAAWLRWLHGDVDGSLQMWSEALRAAGHQDPEPRAWTLTEAGHVEWHRGRLDAAAALYEQALALLPDHAGALFGRGRVRLARGEARAAAADLTASAAARPAELTTEWQALALRAAGDAAAADALDRKLAEAGPFDDDRTIALYLAHRRLDPARAVERARRDFASRQDLYSHDALGFALYRAGQLDEAARHLEAATRYGTPDPMLHAHRGLVAAARGRVDEAREHLDRAWAHNPHAHPLLMAEVAAARAALPAPTDR